MRLAFAITLALPCCFHGSHATWANPVSVANYSFEVLPAGSLLLRCGSTCGYTMASIPGWNGRGALGQTIFENRGRLGLYVVVGDDGDVASLPDLMEQPTPYDGNVLAYLDAGMISQDVTTATAGTTYTLAVAVLHRFDGPVGGVVQLEIGGQVVATAAGPDDGPGAWNDWSTTYTATAADTGQPVTILLGASETPAGFDDVRLDASATATPEPGALALIGAGLVGLGLIRRFRAG